MTPFFTSIPLVDGDQNQDHTLHQHLFSASTPSFPCTTLFFDLNDPGAVDSHEHHFHHDQLEEANNHSSIQVSSHDRLSYESKTNTNQATKSSTCDRYAEMDGPRDSAKWMPSKMRFMRKMMSHDDKIIVRRRRRRSPQGDEHVQEPQAMANDPQNGILRVCSDCKTTKTPLWRSGPQGPKSLCNACGIRQRKARRAMAAAAAAAAAVDAGLIPGDAFNEPKNNEEQEDAIRILPFKKRCKINDDENLEKKMKKKKKKKFCDDGTTNLSKNSGFLTRFPQDERDAAILLMALSCGLICS